MLLHLEHFSPHGQPGLAEGDLLFHHHARELLLIARREHRTAERHAREPVVDDLRRGHADVQQLAGSAVGDGGFRHV
ncbi:hypothetical protein SDC9_173923 [bioreactor metagenome]|uniref:Uncharacterized protein n=1 Tax=bioreactor metagenome TaxID=1076179 RepID=A0A645GHT5_9ZZZZ